MKNLIKKTALSLGFLTAMSVSAMADGFLQGPILEVKDDSKSIVIETIYQGPMEIKVLPSTRIELDDCGWVGMDNIFEDGDFYDLKVGRHVEVEAYYPNTMNQTPTTAMPPRATKIEVKCHKMAY